MTQTIQAHFDGRVFIPDEPVDLPLNEPLRLTVEPSHKAASATALPILADPSRTFEEKLDAVRRTFSYGREGKALPDEALRRESIYGVTILDPRTPGTPLP